MAREEIQHAGAGDHVDAPERSQYCRDPTFHFNLRVVDAAIARDQVGMRRQAYIFSDLRTGQVEHRRFDGAHRSLAGTHVEDGGRASPDDGSPGLRELMNAHSAAALT